MSILIVADKMAYPLQRLSTHMRITESDSGNFFVKTFIIIALLVYHSLCVKAQPVSQLPKSGGEPHKQEKKENLLKTIVVTASRHETESFEIPYTVNVIDLDNIRSRRMSRTVPEIFREIPGILVQKTAHGQGSPFIRGFTGFHTLLMIDGIRLNNSALRSGPNQYWSTVDPLTIQKLEVVKGPTSVLYGSDAIGGTVNAITIQPVYREDDHFGAGIYYRFAGGEDAHVTRIEVHANSGPQFGIIGGGSFKEFGNITAGGSTGYLPETGYKETDGDIKLEYLLRPGHKIIMAWQRVHQDSVPRTHKTLHAVSFEGTSVGSERKRTLDQDRDLLYLQYHRNNSNHLISGSKFSLSWHRQKENRERLKSAGSGGDLQGFEVNTLGIWGQLESLTRVGHLTFGFEYYHDNVDSHKTSFNEDGSIKSVSIQGPIADDATYDLAGIFIQDEKILTDKVDLIAGIRYTHAAVDADRVDVGGVETSLNDKWDNLVGSLRILIRIQDHWNVFMGASQGFRAPNLGDLTRLDDTSAVEVPSPNLGPENFISFEIGTKVRSSLWDHGASYWYTLIDDMIIQSPTGVLVSGTPEVRKDNIGDGWIHGLELESTFKPLDSWQFFGNFSWMDGEVDQLDESAGFTITRAPLSRLMPVTLNLGIRYSPPPSRFQAEGLVTVVDNQDDLALRDKTDTSRIPPGGTPGYTIYTLRGSYRVNERIKISAAVENLTNKNYRIHGSGQNEVGTNVILAVDGQF